MGAATMAGVCALALEVSSAGLATGRNAGAVRGAFSS
jgi:hypothetical protein